MLMYHLRMSAYIHKQKSPSTYGQQKTKTAWNGCEYYTGPIITNDENYGCAGVLNNCQGKNEIFHEKSANCHENNMAFIKYYKCNS